MNMPTIKVDSNLTSLAYAYGPPALQASLRLSVDDFQVSENLGFDLTLEGEHVYLHIEKTNTNTGWLAEQIAKLAKVKLFDVGFAGLKDRHARTRQWFSVYLPKDKGIDWHTLESPEIKLLDIKRHSKKLRRGNLLGNHFNITLRHLLGDQDETEQRLQQILKTGIPNYFGPQRFGFNGNNLESATQLFNQQIRPARAKQSLYLSAARSWLFNLVLDQRIKQGTWQQALTGDVMMLAGTHSYFLCERVDDTIMQRIHEMDISPTGPLYGAGDTISQGVIAELENETLKPYTVWTEGLIKAGLHQERRALILPVSTLRWQFEKSHLHLNFFLPAGSYATSVLKEIALLETSDHELSSSADI